MATPGLEAGLGGVQWELVACLGLAWLMVYLIVWKGLHQSGKVRGLKVSELHFVYERLLSIYHWRSQCERRRS